ncbi:baculoviral IAP repeat-containing protein 7-A-like [Mytilus edulis]|uniref:baculoviral IAP repeat-containing protein 7-A-like n=1 Tax=Mytilus edulis TaxID=6550 RepID=UPI0039EE2599
MNNLEKLLSQNSRRGPKYPQYTITCIRLSTFQTWPTSIQQHPETMAEAGFYYTGNNDHVRCFHCGIGLQNWDSEDNPFVEHARWSQECQFLKDKKGLDFIATVQDAVRRLQMKEAFNNDGITETFYNDYEEGIFKDFLPSGKPPTKAEKKNTRLTDAAQSMLAMGYPDEVVRRAVDRVLIKEGLAGLSCTSLMEEIFMMMEEEIPMIEDSGDIPKRDLCVFTSSQPKHYVVSKTDMKGLPKDPLKHFQLPHELLQS